MEVQQKEVAAKLLRTAGRPPQPCQRCNSEDTKFCYFNNNSTTQPRYFCKTCKRHWTVGGKLRYVPCGGGARKCRQSNKPSVPSSSNAVDPMINGSGGGGMESPSVDVMGLGMTHPIAMSPPAFYGQDLGTESTVVSPPFDPPFRFELNFLSIQPQQPFFPLNPTLIEAPEAMQQPDWLHGFTSTPAAGTGAVEPTWREFLNDEEDLAADLPGLLDHQPSSPPPFI